MNRNYAIIVIMCLLWQACLRDNNEVLLKLKPQAAFTVRNNNCQAPCEVTFFNLTTGGYVDQTIWDFGDGDTSQSYDARHIYKQSGAYVVTLKSKNAVGATLAEKVINIQYDKPLSLFSFCRIDYVIVDSLPLQKPDGTPWDASNNADSLPDLKWHLRAGTRYFSQSEDTYRSGNVGRANLPVQLSREQRFQPITAFNDYYTLYLLDDDGTRFDTISQYTFRPTDYFPVQNNNSNTPSNFFNTFLHQKPEGLSTRITLRWQ